MTRSPHPHSLAREVALQTLFQHDLRSDGLSPEERAAFIANRLEDEASRRFATRIVEGVLRDRERIDALLRRHAENWELSRMAAVDRNVLRIGVWELTAGDTPPKVAIDEAIELAKRFGGKNSGAFVNGILDAVLRCRSGAAREGTP